MCVGDFFILSGESRFMAVDPAEGINEFYETQKEKQDDSTLEYGEHILNFGCLGPVQYCVFFNFAKGHNFSTRLQNSAVFYFIRQDSFHGC